MFSTIYTLTKNRTSESARFIVLKVAVEFLQLFLVLFNSSFLWQISTDLWIWQGIQWLLFRNLVEPKGYATYVTVFYVIAALVLSTLLSTVWVGSGY